MRILSYLFWIFILLLGVSFSAMNSRSIEISHYFGQVNIYLPLLLLIELLIGALLGIAALLPNLLKLKTTLRKTRQLNRRLEEELSMLKPTKKEAE